MRRHGVGPWVAAIAAGAFVLFGPGEQNIIWAFQIGFTGSVTFGLAELVPSTTTARSTSATRSGWPGRSRSSRRASASRWPSWRGSRPSAGAVGEWRCSRPSDRGDHIAWWTVERPDLRARSGARRSRCSSVGSGAARSVCSSRSVTSRWWPCSSRSCSSRASCSRGCGSTGAGAAARRYPPRCSSAASCSRASPPPGAGSSAPIREVQPVCPRRHRLALPVIAIAVDAIVRRRREVGVAATALLLIAIPWNSTHSGRDSAFGSAYMTAREQVIENVVRLPEAAEVPWDVRPIPDVYVGPDLTIGFLLERGALRKAPPGHQADGARVRARVAPPPGAGPASGGDRTGRVSRSEGAVRRHAPEGDGLRDHRARCESR